MNTHEAEAYALVRGRVQNTKTGAVANLVDWMPGAFCAVFVGYSQSLAGHVKMPTFDNWRKSETVKASNDVPVGGAA